MTNPNSGIDKALSLPPKPGGPAFDYDKIQYVRVSADKLVKHADVRTGATVLDVATGTGWVAIGLSKVVGPTGHIVGVDISDDMLQKGRRKVETFDIMNIELRLGDGARLEFEDECFDNVVCSSGLFWIPGMLTALKEWKRVIKYGARSRLRVLDCHSASRAKICFFRSCDNTASRRSSRRVADWTIQTHAPGSWRMPD